jgi:hypothetical protein
MSTLDTVAADVADCGFVRLGVRGGKAHDEQTLSALADSGHHAALASFVSQRMTI